MKKNILITAGGTSEPIDSVRTITNTGTGTLGSMIADEFARYEEVGTIFYVHGHGAVLPKTPKAELLEIGSVEQLKICIETLLDREHIDVIIHSMAVSDYNVSSVLTAETLYECARKAASPEEMLEAMKAADIRTGDKKLSSHMGTPVLLLGETPKVIHIFREKAPEAVIVGFKLLNNVSYEELIDVGYALLQKNDCDYVLANDYVTVAAGRHTGHLIDRQKQVGTYVGKDGIAAGIAHTLLDIPEPASEL